MSTFHLAASSRISTIQYRRSLQLNSSSTSAVLIKARSKHHSSHSLEIPSSQHIELFTSRVRCHVHVLPKEPSRHVAVLGVWSIFLPFIIKRILGIKRTFPCSFGNKRMPLLTLVYGISSQLLGFFVFHRNRMLCSVTENHVCSSHNSSLTPQNSIIHCNKL